MESFDRYYKAVADMEDATKELKAAARARMEEDMLAIPMEKRREFLLDAVRINDSKWSGGPFGKANVGEYMEREVALELSADRRYWK